MTKTSNIWSTVFFTLLLFGAGSAVSAADWYVNPSAAGRNDGTSWTDGWKSFSAIVWGGSGVKAGDTLYVSGGSSARTYTEGLSVPIAGTASNPIRIRPGQTAGHDGLVMIRGANVRMNSYVHLDGRNRSGEIGFSIVNAPGTAVSTGGRDQATGTKVLSIEVDTTGEWGIRLLDADGVEVAYNVLKNTGNDSINFGGSRSNGRFGNNLVHHNLIDFSKDDGVIVDSGTDIYDNVMYGRYRQMDVGHPDGVQMLGSYNRVYNNIIGDFMNSSIFSSPLSRGDHIHVFNNVVYETYDSSRGIQVGTGANVTSVDDVLIANNTIVDMWRWGIYLTAKQPGVRMSNVRIVNNIVYNSMRTKPNMSAVVFSYGDITYSNLVYDRNLVHAGPSGSSVGPEMVNPVTGAPVFQSYRERAHGNDYRLSASSAGIGAGFDLSSNFTTDLEGRRRQGWDVGAYASGSNGSIPAPTPTPDPAPEPSPDPDPVPSPSPSPSPGPNPSPDPDRPAAPSNLRLYFEAPPLPGDDDR